MTSAATVACIAGARPNFMKIAPIMRALETSERLNGVVVHTGQHYDTNMSQVFFAELGIPEPSINLEVGSGTHGVQTGQIMVMFDRAVESIAPDLVLVVGDVNSTLACSLVANKRGVPVAHVEAGLRSYDRSMPEEINRVLTDQISDYLFLTELGARDNLLREGIDSDRIHHTGNTMIDTLVYMMPRIDAVPSDQLGDFGEHYGVVTFHRPSNVDRPEILANLVDLLIRESKRIPLVFPMHPRTRRNLVSAALWDRITAEPGIHVLDPLPYTQFMALVKHSQFVVTDSGGIQEETTWLGVPCVTQRTSTERPSTVDLGTNTLLGEDFQQTSRVLDSVLDGSYKTGQRPPLWDGRCAERIVSILETTLGRGR